MLASSSKRVVNVQCDCFNVLAASRAYQPVASTSYQIARPVIITTEPNRHSSRQTVHSLRNPALLIRAPIRRQFHQTSSRFTSSRIENYLLADVGEGITECEIIKWFVEPGSMVEEFDVLVEVQSDKASVEITSRYAGLLKEHCYKVGEVAKVGSPLCKIEVAGGEDAEARGSVTSTEQDAAKDNVTNGDTFTGEASPSTSSRSLPLDTSGNGPSLATPAVRRILREKGININSVTGTGKSGRITKEDVQGYMSSQEASLSTSNTSTSAQQPFEMTTIPLTGNRKAMYKAMSASWNIPHFGYSDEIDITRIEAIRKEMQETLSKQAGNSISPHENKLKLTLLPLLLKALSITLSQHPIFRSTLDEKNMTLIEKQQHCISIALSSPRGLLTPTLAGDVRLSSIADIAEQVNSLQRISNERSLTSKEMGSGATITLSNIGSIGGTFTFPLIPPTGQVVIGAIGQSRLLPRFDQEGDLIKSLILPVSFSADHRVVEGVELAKFVQDWKTLVENPSSWLLQMR